jgi:hypothetical protein
MRRSSGGRKRRRLWPRPATRGRSKRWPAATGRGRRRGRKRSPRRSATCASQAYASAS